MTLRERLDACAEKGSLSTADLAVWFSAPHATITSYRKGVEPWPHRRPQIEQRLKWLEQAVNKSSRFPIPLEIRKRKPYVTAVLRDFDR